jgi:hypothetical protein
VVHVDEDLPRGKEVCDWVLICWEGACEERTVYDCGINRWRPEFVGRVSDVNADDNTVSIRSEYL